MFISSSDIKDYFYEVAVPESLSAFLGLDDAPASLVAELTGSADAGKTPFLTVLPMGWSWSFFFAQLIHVQQIGEAAPELADRILDDISPLRGSSKSPSSDCLTVTICRLGLAPRIGPTKCGQQFKSIWKARVFGCTKSLRRVIMPKILGSLLTACRESMGLLRNVLGT